MAMSVGLLSFIILCLIIAHAGIFVAYYFHRRKQPPHSTRFTLTGSTARSCQWLMVILITLTCILGIYASAACDFLIVAIPNVQFNPQETLDWGIGFSHIDMPSKVASYYGQDGGCESLDTNLGNLITIVGNSTAKTFSIFNCILTTFGMLFAFVLACKKRLTAATRRDLIWLIMRIIMYISMWCAILSFYLQETVTCDAYVCSLGVPAYVQMVNVVFLLIINFVLFFTNPGQESFIQSCYLSAEEARRRDSVMTPDVNVTDDPTEYPNRDSMATPGARNSTRMSNNATRMSKTKGKLSNSFRT